MPCTTDPSPAAQVRASVTYNHIVEGMLALTGYYAWHKICVDRGILPGMQELVRRIGDDERRHMAWGTFTCRRHVAADDANWAVFEDRMNELIPLALRLTEEGFALYAPDIPFGLEQDEFMRYSAGQGHAPIRHHQQRPRPPARGDRPRLLTADIGGHVRRRGRDGRWRPPRQAAASVRCRRTPPSPTPQPCALDSAHAARTQLSLLATLSTDCVVTAPSRTQSRSATCRPPHSKAISGTAQRVPVP